MQIHVLCTRAAEKRLCEMGICFSLAESAFLAPVRSAGSEEHSECGAAPCLHGPPPID